MSVDPLPRRPMPTGAQHVHRLLVALDQCGNELSETTERWGRRLAEGLPSGRRLLAAGNGGSAAQAQHLTAELVGRYRDDRPPFSAVALTAETSSLTAISNDFGADEVFARQVRAHGRERDVLLLLSTSGTSTNILRAADEARRLGLEVWALTGASPNPLVDRSDDALTVPSDATATIQEVHLLAVHLICAALDVALGVAPRMEAVQEMAS
jgi:D-sedoheptulose 7-phosphate isomerase